MGHAPNKEYSGSSADLVYALNEDGKLVHISEVSPGADCKCLCPNPSCGKPLVAKVRQLTPNQYGKYKAKHFAHGADQSCANAPESALHLLAKEIVEDELLLLLPEVRATYAGVSRVLHKSSEVRFTHAIQEAKTLKEVIPDIYLECDGHLLLVEIFVTHACDEEKSRQLKVKGIATVEIDLSRFPRDARRTEVMQAVLRDARRYWVFHPKIDAAVAAMKLDAEQKQLAEKEALKKKVDALAGSYVAGLKELTAKATPKLDKKSELFRVGLEKQIGVTAEGAGCFTVNAREWQHSILQDAFLLPEGEAKSYSVKNLFDWLKKRGLIRSEFRFVPPDLEEALVDRGVGFIAPYRAIEHYLETLVTRGILVHRANTYGLASGITEKLSEWRRAEELRCKRRKDITDRANRIFDALPEAERQGSNGVKWLAHPQASGISFRQAIESDDPRYDAMIDALRSIEAMMFRKGVIVEETLGLPIAAERERQHAARAAEAEAREGARLEAERRDREKRRQCLVTAASAFASGGADWLNAPNAELGAASPIDTALGGDAGLERALEALNREAFRRKAQREREAAIAACRADLEFEVTRRLGDAARPFLASPYVELGNKRPTEYCVSKTSLHTCIDLAEKVRKRLRR